MKWYSWMILFFLFSFLLSYFNREYVQDYARANAFTECDELGGTLIISADERYICVPDAREVGGESNAL